MSTSASWNSGNDCLPTNISGGESNQERYDAVCHRTGRRADTAGFVQKVAAKAGQRANIAGKASLMHCTQVLYACVRSEDSHRWGQTETVDRDVNERSALSQDDEWMLLIEVNFIWRSFSTKEKKKKC